MQSEFINYQENTLSTVASSDSMILTYTNNPEKSTSFDFAVSFAGYMDMYGDLDTVADYFNAHEGWFCRCAKPMKVEPLENNAYVLTVGRFGSFGYEVEPKIAVVLSPPVDGVYPMSTIPIPNYDPPGYDVVYEAEMKLNEIEREDIAKSSKNLFGKKIAIPHKVIRVTWTLNLSVTVEFPKFINKLPKSTIQSTGDRVLAQIVNQISPRLTYKVQQDFHSRYNLPMPPKSSRKLEKISNTQRCVA